MISYSRIFEFGIIKTTIIGTVLSIVLSEIITIGLALVFGVMPREHVIIAFIAPLIIAPMIIVLFFRLLVELKDVKDEVRVLSGMLPICTNCKKIRDDTGYWNQIESYIKQHSEAVFSHSICPACMDKLYGKEDWYIRQKQKTTPPKTK